MASDHLTLRSGAALLDTYLSDLAARLPGPRRRREQILAELRDGLEHAITDHMTAGLPERDAVTAAIAQFGTPQAVAKAFAGELATAYARRTIACYIATGPLVDIWRLLLLQPHPWRTSLVALLAAIPVIPLIIIAIATAAGAFATTGRLMRWLPEASPGHALAATTTIAAFALAGDVTVIAHLRPVRPSGALTRPHRNRRQPHSDCGQPVHRAPRHQDAENHAPRQRSNSVTSGSTAPPCSSPTTGKALGDPLVTPGQLATLGRAVANDHRWLALFGLRRPGDGLTAGLPLLSGEELQRGLASGT